MESLLMQLLDKARSENAVASCRLTNGMHLLAYPLQSGSLVGLGFERDSAYQVHPETILRKRSMDPAHYAAWLPAVFTDGSCYVVRRVTQANPGGESPGLTGNDLMVAQELLS